jgi:hypothetical protein
VVVAQCWSGSPFNLHGQWVELDIFVVGQCWLELGLSTRSHGEYIL